MDLGILDRDQKLRDLKGIAGRSKQVGLISWMGRICLIPEYRTIEGKVLWQKPSLFLWEGGVAA